MNPRHFLARMGCLVILAVFIGRTAAAQIPSSNTPRLELRAAPAGVIKLDGKLDEAAWKAAGVATNFVQRYPDPGHPATMRTEVRILYDANAIYVGARMFDPHPDSILAPLARRDPGDVTSDWIDVIFDSNNDRRTGYRFGVNPAGTKLDVYHFNDSDDDESWDALWDVATTIDSLGWTAEYRIPLSQLRFHGSHGEQTWGINFYRAVARRDEWSFWSPYPPTAPGFVSAFGILRGLVGIEPPSPVEVVPYASSRMASRPVVQNNPLLSHNNVAANGGVDFRVGLGSSLSLTGTINPDFGQVEVDPAVINLSAVETFLPEKRPFFLEGSGIFQFGPLPVDAALTFSRFVHWRRVGREPQLTPDALYSDVPEQTTIIGAGKLSGQLSNGLSIGVIDAVTQRENATTIDGSGKRGIEEVEPFTNYFVGRVKKDLNDGRSTLGLLATSVSRSLSGNDAALLRRGGYLFGIDGSAASHDRHLTTAAFLVRSEVVGSAAAIAATQLSSARYYQRPDQQYVAFDPTRRALEGHDAGASMIFQGDPWFASAEMRETSPGYESNDLGYLSRADTRTATAAFGAIRNTSAGLFRSSRVTAYTQNAWNFGGDNIYRRVGATGSSELSSFWTVLLRGAVRAPAFSDKHTRGGPLIRLPGTRLIGGAITSDNRRRIVGGVEATYENKGRNGIESTISTTVKIRPSPSLELSAGPSLYVLRDEAQYITTIPDALATATFGQRYVFATLRQKTLSVDTRVNWTLTPAFSFQLFAQPFISPERFAGYKELRSPRTYDFDVFGRNAGSIKKLPDGTVSIDPDGPGPAAGFVVGQNSDQTSFIARALRVNAVVRWEYRSGSSIYIVWQQQRDATDPLFPDQSAPGAASVLGLPMKNIFVVKATYRIGR